MSSNAFRKAIQESLSQLREEESKRSDEERQQRVKALDERFSTKRVKSAPTDDTKPTTH